jgi:biopolymer transport protein ExbD
MMRKRKGEPGPEVVLPIVPMLDMAFQLLAYFIMVYHPSALEGQMQLALPAAGEAKAKSEMDVDPNILSDTEAEPPSEMTVVIKTQQDGGNASVPNTYLVENTLQGSAIPMTTLKEVGDYLHQEVERLRKERADEVQRLRARGTKLSEDEKKRLRQLQEFSVKVKPASRLRFTFVADIMDAAARAGFTSVGFAPPPDLDSGG